MTGVAISASSGSLMSLYLTTTSAGIFSMVFVMVISFLSVSPSIFVLLLCSGIVIVLGQGIFQKRDLPL